MKKDETKFQKLFNIIRIQQKIKIITLNKKLIKKYKIIQIFKVEILKPVMKKKKTFPGIKVIKL